MPLPIRSSTPGGTAWQLKVFVQNQASSQLFVDGLDVASRRINLGAYPAALAPKPWIFPLLTVGSVILGFGLMTYNVNQQAIRGAVIPNQMLGRVSAGLFVLVAVGNVAGSLLGGLLGQSIGLFGTLVVATALGATAALPAIFSPLPRLRELPAAE